MILAQDLFSSFPLATKKPIRVVHVPDSNGNLCLYYHDLMNHYFELINHKGEHVRRRQFQRLVVGDTKELFVGATVNELYYHLFFQNPNNEKVLSVFKISKGDTLDKVYNQTKLELESGFKILKFFSVQNGFYILALNKSKATILLLKLIDEREKEEIKMSISKELVEVLQEGNFALIKNSQIHNVNSLLPTTKVYVRDSDHIIVISDEFNGLSKIYKLNLPLKQETFNQIGLVKDLNDKSYIKFASYYFKDQLFKIQFSSKKLGLFIYDGNNGNLDKKYLYEDDSTMELISNSKVRNQYHVLSGGAVGIIGVIVGPVKTEKDLDSTNIIKKIKRGDPVLSVGTYLGDTLGLFAGSYSKVYIPRIGSAYTTMWFNSFISNKDFTIIKNLNDYPDFYKVSLFEQDLYTKRISYNELVSFKLKGVTYFGYIDVDKKLYQIQEADSWVNVHGD